MKPIETETTNAVYTLEGCNDLPVTKYNNVSNGEPGVESCWELTPEEIKQVQETGKVYLYIQGNIVPPVLITTESTLFFPDEEPNERTCTMTDCFNNSDLQCHSVSDNWNPDLLDKCPDYDED